MKQIFTLILLLCTLVSYSAEKNRSLANPATIMIKGDIVAEGQFEHALADIKNTNIPKALNFWGLTRALEPTSPNLSPQQHAIVPQLQALQIQSFIHGWQKRYIESPDEQEKTRKTFNALITHTYLECEDILGASEAISLKSRQLGSIIQQINSNIKNLPQLLEQPKQEFISSAIKQYIPVFNSRYTQEHIAELMNQPNYQGLHTAPNTGLFVSFTHTPGADGLSPSRLQSLQIIGLCTIICDFAYSVNRVRLLSRVRNGDSEGVTQTERHNLRQIQDIQYDWFKHVFQSTPIAAFTLEETNLTPDDSGILELIAQLSKEDLSATIAQVNRNIKSLNQTKPKNRHQRFLQKDRKRAEGEGNKYLGKRNASAILLIEPYAPIS